MNSIELAIFNLRGVTDLVWPFSPQVGRRLKEDCRRYLTGDPSVLSDISNLTRLSRCPAAQQFQAALTAQSFVVAAETTATNSIAEEDKADDYGLATELDLW